MARTTYNQAGFEAVGVIVALLFVAVIGFAGYKVLNLNKSAPAEQSSVTVSPVVPGTIKTHADLGTTSKALDKSQTQIDSSLNDKSLDSDLNSML